MDYYSKLTYSQLRATNLLIEAYHFRKQKQQPRQAMDEYKSLLLGQESTFIRNLVPLVAAGVAYFDWSKIVPTKLHVWSFGQSDAAAQLHPGIQWLPGDVDRTSGYYAPSSVFAAAEKLLANLYVTKPEDRRIVVHMLYTNGANGSIATAVNAVPLTLDHKSSVIQPLTDQLGPFLYPGYFLIDSNYDWIQETPDKDLGRKFWLNRCVYSTDAGALKDGTYKLTDLNGHSGLVQLQTYAADNVPFQEPRVLGYQLQIGPSAPFDYMNFAAYMVGVGWPDFPSPNK
jgi:hypothetical protein